MFRIAAAPDRDRREPTLTGAPRLVSPDPSRLAPPERLTPIAARERARWLGPITSLVLHLLPLLLLIEWPMAAPPVVEPITVQLVLEPPPPPPPPPPSPLPPKPEFKPPPPGRIASEDLGDTEMKEASREPSDQPAAKDTSPPPPPAKTEVPPPPPEKTEPPPESPQQTAPIVPPPPPEKPTPPKPQTKPNPNARQALHSEEEPAHTASRHAKYPGPAATRDEYLAYVHSLIRQHYNMLPLAMVGGRRGETQVEFVVLDDGTIGAIRLRQSSGWQDIDARVELMIAAVRRVPPLPQWFQGPSMALVLNLPFPDALRE